MTRAQTSTRSISANRLPARRLGIDTLQEAVVFMHVECGVCRSEGFEALARIRLEINGRSVIASLFKVTSDLVSPDEVGLSESAWQRLGLQTDGDAVSVHYAQPLMSLGAVRAKIFGHRLESKSMVAIIEDVVAGRYADVHISSFLTACSARPLDRAEVIDLTRAMADAGDSLNWQSDPVVDKHSVGGLPGNRTTPIVVAIVTAFGLTMPKTSSRAITSPAGTADTMETMAPVALDLTGMRRVVEQEGGCIVWGGAMHLSPADDILIRVERALDLDPEGQLIASVLSKKIAAGATDLVLDLPVGPTAKVRDQAAALSLSEGLVEVAEKFGLRARVLLGDGSQPIGFGIGPALEARDVMAVLQGSPAAPRDLRDRSVELAATLLEMASGLDLEQARRAAQELLDRGQAWTKFQAICEAQGGMREPPRAPHTMLVAALKSGRVSAIDNRLLSRIAKLAGAPDAKSAGIEIHVRLGDAVDRGEPLFTLHAETPGELAYALDFLSSGPSAVAVS